MIASGFPVEEFDWSGVLNEEHSDSMLTKRHYCGFEGCSKSYSNRQNAYRHRQIHFEGKNKKSLLSFEMMNVHLQRERNLVIETFNSFCEKIGEEEATATMRNNQKLKEHTVSLRKKLESDMAEHLAEAQDSETKVDIHLTNFHLAFSNGTQDQLATFMAVVDLIKKATPESIVYLKLFSKVVSSLTSHMENFSEAVNPKCRHARALKILLDELFTEAVDELVPNSLSDGGERKAKSHEAPVSSCKVQKPAKNLVIVDNFLIGDDKEDLLNFDDEKDLFTQY